MKHNSSSALEKAVAQMDASSVIALVGSKGSEGAWQAARTLWASEALYEKHSDKKAAARRNFIEELSDQLSSICPDASAKASELADVLDLVERGFASILRRAGDYPGAKLAPMTQVSAALHRVTATKSWVVTVAQDNMPPGPKLRVRENFDVDGRRMNPDSEMLGVMKAAVATIMMMAYKNSWFTADGTIQLPLGLTRPSEDDQKLIESVLEYANVWHVWDRAQTRLRLSMDKIQYMTPPFPPELETTVDSVLRVMPNDDIELVDYIANTRLLARTKQHYAELLGTKFAGMTYPDLTQQVRLPPDQFISFDEALGLVTLAECTAYNVAEDSRPYSGLRIVEWLRGYAVLKRTAEEDDVSAMQHHDCPQFLEADLIMRLCRGGLPTDRARRFIRHACLSRSRNDPYDRPLIKVNGDQYVLVAPALKAALLGPIVLSAISDSGAALEPKGKAFEKVILKKIAGKGRTVRSFKAKRGREEYDYDAMMVWGDYCFLFECKNRGLSGGILQYVYRTIDESRGHARQVSRLVEGLMANPDFLDKNLPDARGKLLVPCVISALPFAIPGGIENIFFADYSMLTRFFALASIGEVGVYKGKGTERQPDGEMIRQWSGDEPTPLDLLRFLRHPFQYTLVRHHTVLQPVVTGVFSPQDVLLHGEYASTDMTPESGREAARIHEELAPLMTDLEWEGLLRRLP